MCSRSNGGGKKNNQVLPSRSHAVKLIQDPDILNDCIKYGRMDGRFWLQKTQDGDGHNARLEASKW